MVVDLGRDLAHTFARKEKVLVAAPWLTLLDHATSPYARPRTPEEFCGHLGHHRAVFSGSDADHPIAPAVKLYEERAPRARRGVGGGSGGPPLSFSGTRSTRPRSSGTPTSSTGPSSSGRAS